MSQRQNPTLAQDVTAVDTPGVSQYASTGGFLNSVSAQLATGSTSATVEIYVNNHNYGKGVKIATFNLTSANPSDGFSLPREDNGWFFVRAEVTALVGTVKIVSACVGGV